MLCLPGFTPVAKLDQAVGDSEGCEDCSGEKPPCSDSFLRFGSLPSSMNVRRSVGSMPWKPMMKALPGALRAGLLVFGAPWQATSAPAATRAAAAVRRKRDIGLLVVSVRRGQNATF